MPNFFMLNKIITNLFKNLIYFIELAKYLRNNIKLKKAVRLSEELER